MIEVEGVPLWQRQRDMLASAGATEIFLSARPDQAWSRNRREFAAVIHDAMPGCGPMVGITAAIERSTHPLVAAVAVDLPLMNFAWFRSLLSHCTDGRGAVGHNGEFFEPLAAIYPRQAMWLMWEALSRAQYSLQELIKTAVAKNMLNVRELASAEKAFFVNFNAPQRSA